MRFLVKLTSMGVIQKDLISTKGRKIKIDTHNKFNVPVQAKQISESPNARRAILQRTLRDGAAWEMPTVEVIAKMSKTSKNKYLKKRIGTKAAKQYEKLENVSDLLDSETSTMFRALSARFLCLSMDRPECAFASKELC